MQGRVVGLATASGAGAPVEAQTSIQIVRVKGVVGDRYAEGTGHFKGHPDAEVTLVEKEDAEAVGLEPEALRRNIVTEGVRLGSLIGRTFRIGTATLHGMRACLPCGYLARGTGKLDLKETLQGGLRARVVHPGEVRLGDALEPVPPTLDADMKAVIESAHLAFVATVTSEGMPNVSPKGTIRVLDDTRLFYLDIASEQTRKNLLTTPFMEMNVVDHLSRRGYRFFGKAAHHKDDDIARAARERIIQEGGADFGDVGAVVLTLDRILPLVSPGYRFIPDESAMREEWRPLRADLDAAFEEHLRGQDPYTLSGKRS